MKNFKKIISIGLICLLALSMVACGGGGDNNTAVGESTGAGEYNFTLGLDSPEDTVTFLFANKFKDIVAEKTDGKIQIQVYPNGQLGNDRELVESAQAGNVDFVVQNTAPQVNFIPELAVFDMANVFPDGKTARTVLDGPFLDTIAAEYEKAGLKLFGYADQGFRVMSTNKKIEKMEDFKGQKIRTMENPNHLEYWNALGANPTPMAFGEVYIGLQQGTIDAQENPYEVIVSAKLYEQQDYVINTNHILHLISLITNKDLYGSLPEEYQKIMDEAAAEAIQWARQEADNRVADRVSIMEENGVEIIDLSEELYTEMQGKAAVVYESIRSKIGAELVDGILSAVEGARN